MSVISRPSAVRAVFGRHERKLNGFTLIEVLVAVAIISILAAIALPNYSDYVTRSRITEGTAGLANKRALLELFYDNNHTYVGAPDCNADSVTTPRFTFSCSASGATTYTLQAVGAGSMANFTFTINQANAKATTSVPSGWTANAACWIRQKDGTC